MCKKGKQGKQTGQRRSTKVNKVSRQNLSRFEDTKEHSVVEMKGVSTMNTTSEGFTQALTLTNKVTQAVTLNSISGSFKYVEPITEPVNHSVRLTPTEFKLLSCLMLQEGESVSCHELINSVWGGGRITPDCVHLHIRRLQHKLGDDPENPSLIVAGRGLSYYWNGPGKP